MAFDLHHLHICTTVETILTTHWSQVCSHLIKGKKKSTNAKMKAIMTNGLLHWIKNDWGAWSGDCTFLSQMRLATQSQITPISLLTNSGEWTTSPSQFCHVKKAHINYQTFRFHTAAAKLHPFNNKHWHHTHIYYQTFRFHTQAVRSHRSNITHIYHQIFQFHTFWDWAALDTNWGVTFLTSLQYDWHVMENPSCETPTPQNCQTL